MLSPSLPTLAATAAREQVDVDATLRLLHADPMSLAACEDGYEFDPDPNETE